MNITSLSFPPGLATARASLDSASASLASSNEALSSGQGGSGNEAMASAVVQQQAAVYAFKASLKSLEVQSTLIGSIVDVHA